MGAAERAGTLDSGQRHSHAHADSNSNAHSDSNCHANSDPNGNADSHSSSWRRRLMRSGLEFHSCLLQYLNHNL